MNLASWFRGKLSCPVTARSDEAYGRAMALTDEVSVKMRERSNSPDPFRALMADLWRQHHDVALVAESFETHQESRIYLGRNK